MYRGWMVYASRHRKCVYLQNLGCSHSNQKLSQRKYTTCNTFTYQFIEGAFHLMKFPSIFRHEQGCTCSWGYDLSSEPHRWPSSIILTPFTDKRARCTVCYHHSPSSMMVSTLAWLVANWSSSITLVSISILLSSLNSYKKLISMTCYMANITIFATIIIS